MFDEFRRSIKKAKSEQGLTYAQMSEKVGAKEQTFKCFMCGANDSRRVAEKIADALGMELLYSNGIYKLKKMEEKTDETDETDETHERMKALEGMTKEEWKYLKCLVDAYFNTKIDRFEKTLKFDFCDFKNNEPQQYF